MKAENDIKLCNDFPQLYRERNLGMSVTCMCWGFSCGDGWFDLIYELSTKLDTLFKKHGLMGNEYPACAQVKEKFGDLRFYMNTIPKEIYEEAYHYISEAEEKSAKTCEVCGAPGKLGTTRGWCSTLCDAHRLEREKPREQELPKED